MVNGDPIAPFAPVVVTGAAGSLTYSISGDALAAGLSLDSGTGRLSGASNGLNGTYDYVMRVIDSAGQSINVPFTLTYTGLVANLQIPRVVISSGTAVQGTVIPIAFAGGTGARTISVSPSLPPGLTIDASTGQLTGTTSLAVTSNYTVTASDSGTPRSTASRTFTLVVDGLPPFINSLSSDLFVTSGGAVITVNGFQLGPRFGSNPQVRIGGSVLGGVPTGGTVVPSVDYATDGRSLTFTIPPFSSNYANEPLYVSTDSGYARAFVRVGRPLEVGTFTRRIFSSGQTVDLYPIGTFGGAGPIVFDTTGTTLPGTLVLDPTRGHLTGAVPTAPGEYGFNVLVYDDTGQANGIVREVVFEVRALVTATAPNPTVTFQQGQPLPANYRPVTTVGGLAPLTFSAVGLPTGLTMDPMTGVVSGTPTRTQSGRVYVTVADSTAPNPNSTRVDFNATVSGFRLNQTTAAIGFRSGRVTTTTTNGFTPVTVASGSGEVGAVTYSISPALPTGMTLDGATGRISGVPTARIPYTTFTISATDQATPAPAIASTQFRLEVLDENPSISNISPAIGPLAGGTTVTVTGSGFGPRFANATAVTLGGTPVNNLVIAPDGLSFTLTTAPSATATGAALVVTNSGLITSTAQSTFTYQNPVIPPPLVSTLAAPTVALLNGRTANARPVTATGGTGTLTYTIAPAAVGGPSLPSGLTFSATTGAITGTPSVLFSVTSFVVTATDQATPAITTSQTFSLSVVAPPSIIPTPSITSFNGNVGFAFFPVSGGSRVVMAGSGFSADMTAVVANVPVIDLVVNSTTSAEFTMPVVPGATPSNSTLIPVVLTRPGAQNPGGRNFFWGPALQVTAVARAPLVVGVAAHGLNLVSGSGGVGTITYQMDDGAGGPIPAGLTFNTANANLTGTPTASLSSGEGAISRKQFRITATDSDTPKRSVSTTFNLEIGIPMVANLVTSNIVLAPNVPMTPVAPVSRQFGTAITTGNTSGPLFMIASGNLPSGLTLDPITGVISGTPTQAYSQTSLTMRAIDAGVVGYGEQTVDFSFSMTVTPLLATTKVSDVTSALGDTVSITPVTATGGATPLSFAIAPALPFGLSFNTATGVITGTAQTPQNATQHTITVSDSAPVPATSSQIINITVSAPLPTITSISPSSGTIDGDTVVTIRGTNFRMWPSYGNVGPSMVGGGSFTSYTVDSDTQITAVTGAASAGLSNIVINAPQGNSANTSADDFEYVAGLSMTATLTGPTSAIGDFDVEMTTPEEVTPLILGSWQITNGTAVAVRKRDKVQSVTVRPTAPGPVTIYVPARFGAGVNSGIRIARTNDLTVQTRVSASATLTITGSNSSPTRRAINLAEYLNFTFSEPVTNFTMTDLTANAGTTLSEFNQGFDGRTYTVKVDRTTDGLATVSLTGQVSDANGADVVTDGTYSFTIDRTGPRLTASGPSTSRLYSGPVRLIWRSNEDVTGLVGTRGGFGTQVSTTTVAIEGSRVFEMTLTPNTDFTGIFETSIFGAMDEAGNRAEVDFTPALGFDPAVPASAGQAFQRLNPFYVFDSQGSFVKITQASGANPVAGSFDAKIDFTYTDLSNFGYPAPELDGVTQFATSNITVANGRVTQLTCPTSPRFTDLYGPAIGSCIARIVPNGQGPVSVSVAASVAVDRAGNANKASNVLTLPLATTVTSGSAPSLAITSPLTLTNAPQLVTFTFSKPVIGFDEDEILVNAGARVAQFTEVNPSTYTAVISRSSDGVAEASVAAGAAEDATGMGSLPATGSFTVDVTSPTAMVNVAGDTVVPAELFDATIVFSESVNGFDLADLALVNGVASNLRPGTLANSYLVSILPGAGSTVEVGVFDGAASDTAGNSSRTLNLVTKTIDAVVPTATLARVVPNGIVTGPFEVVVTFSKPAVGVVAGDFSLINGSLSEFACLAADALSPAAVNSCTFKVSPVLGMTISISLPAASWADRVGNSGTAATLMVATAPPNPSVALSTASTATKTGPFSLNIDFSATVTGLEAQDFVVSNAIVSDLQGSGASYTVLVSPTADGQVSINLPANSTSNQAGAGNLVSNAFAIAADITAPALLISGPSTLRAGPFQASFQFSESVTGFELADITATNATISSFAGSGAAYTATINPAGDGAVTLNVAAGAASDLAGLVSRISNSFSVLADVTPPRVTLVGPTGVQSGPFDVTVTFNEAVIGLEASDFVLTNGTLSGFTCVPADAQSPAVVNSCSFRVTPALDTTVTITLSANSWSDRAGNFGPAASLNVTTATANLTVALTMATDTTKTGPFTATIVFSEAATGLELQDFVVTNARLSELQGSAARYTVLVTPTADGQVTLALPANSAINQRGAGSLVSNSLATLADLTAPRLVISGPSTLQPGPFQASFQFSEPVTGFELADLAATNATLGTFSGSGALYTAIVTPRLDGAVSLTVSAGAANDLAGLASTASNVFVVQADVTPPAVVITGPTAIQLRAFEVTLTFSETVSGLEITDFIVANATVSGLTGAGNAYRITVTPTATGTVTLSLPTGAVRDAAGQNSVASTVFSVLADLNRPVITTVIPGFTVNFNVNANETDLTKLRSELIIQNTGNARGTFSAVPSVNWLNVTPTQGTVDAGQSITLVVTPNASVNRLAAGSYQGFITLTYSSITTARGTQNGEATPSAVESSVFTVPFDIVVASRRGTITIIAATAQPALSGDASFTYSSPEASLNNLQLTTQSGRASSTAVELPVGRYDIKQSLQTNWVLTSINCVGDTDSGTTTDLANRSAIVDLDGGESLTCTFTNSLNDGYVITQTKRAVYSLLTQRARLMASNEPDIGARLDAAGGSGVGNNGSLNVDVQGGRTNLNFGGSLSALWTTPDTRKDLARLMQGEDSALPRTSLARLDLWFQGNLARSTLKDEETNTRSKSEFGIAYLGADYVLSSNVRLGLLAQFDTIEQKGQAGQSDGSGKGWMVGPYVAWRMDSGLVLSGRTAWGQSTNTINPLGRYQEEFDADRMMVSAKLSKEMKLFEDEASKWAVRPEVSLYYFREEQKAFTSRLGPVISASAVSLGEARLGPEFIYRGELGPKSDLEWTFKLLGVAAFDPPELADTSGRVVDALGRYSARLETGLKLQVDSGFVFNARINIDGLGSSSGQSQGANLSISKAY